MHIYVIYPTRRISQSATHSVARLMANMHLHFMHCGLMSTAIYKDELLPDCPETIQIKPRSRWRQRITSRLWGSVKNHQINSQYFCKRCFALMVKQNVQQAVVLASTLQEALFFAEKLDPRRVIFWCHNMPTLAQQDTFLRLIRQPVVLITPSIALYRLIWNSYQQEVLPFQFFHIPHFTGQNRLLYPAKPRQHDDNVLRFVHAGGNAPNKGLEFLINIFQSLAQDGEVGDAKVEFHYIAARPEEKKIGTLKLIGHPTKKPDELMAWLQEMDIGLMPSLWFENYPVLLREFLQAGLVPIASHAGGIPELLEGFQGLLIENPNSLSHWKQAIKSMILKPVWEVNQLKQMNADTYMAKYANNQQEISQKWQELLHFIHLQLP